VLSIFAGLNQALSIGLMAVVCYIVQKIIDKHPRGYLIHLMNNKIPTGLFLKNTKYRI